VIEIGKYNTLEILRLTTVGLFLGDESGEDVLLPNKYCPEDFEIGDELEVFVYRDHAERKVATSLTPYIELHQFALLEVTDVTELGAFLDWGLEKNLMVPFSEQRQKMRLGRWYVVFLNLDDKTDRLYATNKVEKHLSNEELTVARGDKVDLLILSETELGFSVIVNHQHKGLIYNNEIFKELKVGDVLSGYVKKIREDNKLDISLQPLGYTKFNDENVQKIYDALVANGGSLDLTDRSSPEQIYARFGLSKKAFKKAVGGLYKQRKITIEPDGIHLAQV